MPRNDFPKPLVSSGWLNDHLSDPDLIVLDATVGKVGVGLKEVFATQWITGSRFFDLDGKFSLPGTHLPHMLPSPEHFTREARSLGINQMSKIVVYDKWGVYSAPRIWWMFRAMGHDDVSVLNGGYPGWEIEGFPTQSEPSNSSDPGDFVARLRPEMVKNSWQVLEALSDAGQLVIDARPAARFNGAAPEPREHLRSGHMPGAKNLPFPDALDGNFLKSEVELKTIFQSLNAAQKDLIFSCGSGLKACIDELAAKIAGIDKTSIYDGSWSEWGEPGDFPVVKSD